MFGNSYRCTDCDFEFCSGWSHHSAGQHVVCKICASEFTLGGGESEWGTHVGELLQFFAFDGEADVPTGLFVVIEEKDFELGQLQQNDGISRLEFSPVECPTCQSMGSIVQWFEPEQKCPKCKAGSVQLCGSCIY